MTTIALAGDWHGNLRWASARLMSLGERGIATLLHVGDFGLWPGPSGRTFLEGIDKVARRYGVTRIDVVPGNHDDWGRLTDLFSRPEHHDATGAPLPVSVSEVVRFLPRGYRWVESGRSFVALGGAPSLDYASRSPGETWWPEEMIEPADVKRTVAGGHADVMLTHDAPEVPFTTPGVAEVLATNPMGWSDRALAYAKLGRDRVTEAFLGVAPRLLVHGHFHTSGETTVRLPGRDHDTRIWSLDSDGKHGNVRLLDLDSLDDPRPLERPRS